MSFLKLIINYTKLIENKCTTPVILLNERSESIKPKVKESKKENFFIEKSFKYKKYTIDKITNET